LVIYLQSVRNIFSNGINNWHICFWYEQQCDIPSTHIFVAFTTIYFIIEKNDVCNPWKKLRSIPYDWLWNACNDTWIIRCMWISLDKLVSFSLGLYVAIYAHMCTYRWKIGIMMYTLSQYLKKTTILQTIFNHRNLDWPC